MCFVALSACVARVLWLVDTGGCSAPIGRHFPPVVAGVTVRLLRRADVTAGAPSSLPLLPESNKGWGNSDGALIFRTEQRLPPTTHCRAGSIFHSGWLENKRWLRRLLLRNRAGAVCHYRSLLIYTEEGEYFNQSMIISHQLAHTAHPASNSSSTKTKCVALSK